MGISEPQLHPYMVDPKVEQHQLQCHGNVPSVSSDVDRKLHEPGLNRALAWPPVLCFQTRNDYDNDVHHGLQRHSKYVRQDHHLFL